MAGLMTMVLPAAMAGALFHAAISLGDVQGGPGGLHRLFGVLRAGFEHSRVDLPRRRVDGLERLARRRVGERSSDEELERLGRLAHGVSVPPGIDASHRTEA